MAGNTKGSESSEVNHPPTPDSPPSGEALDRSALAGAAWSSGAKWSTQIFAWAGTVLVARILTPADIGLLTVAGVFIAVVLILSESGIGATVLMLRELSVEETRQLNSVSVILGVGASVFTAVMAHPLGLFFRAPQLPPVLTLIGLTFLIKSFQTIPAAILRRNLRFRTAALIDVVRGLVVPVVTLIGALIGLRYWALAIGNVVGAVITAGLTIYASPVSFRRPDFAKLGPVLNYSRHLLVSRLAWVTYSNGDFAVAGRRLSMSSVGDYGMAWTLATSPIEKVTMVVAEVTPPIFSAAQHDRAALRRYFLNFSELLSCLTIPAATGLALIAHDLVTVVLGPKWVGVAAPLALLAVYAGIRSVTILYAYLFTAVRDTRFAMWNSMGLAVLLITGFIIGSAWGPVGIATAWLIVHPAVSVYTFMRVQRSIELKASTYLRALRLGIDGAAIMAAVLLAFQTFVAASWPASLRLAASIILGAVVYAGTTYVLHGTRIRAVLAWMRRVRGGAPVSVSDVA